jgi:hypothetical protein
VLWLVPCWLLGSCFWRLVPEADKLGQHPEQVADVSQAVGMQEN